MAGKATDLKLGNLDARRDWGHAADYVQAIWLMLQQDQPDDYVIATGVTHSVRELCELAFEIGGLDYRKYVISDAQLVRPAEADLLVGNAAKARAKLNWAPRSDFNALVREMVLADCTLLGVVLPDEVSRPVSV